MILIKSRSSRLFVVLLHLLGVSTHFPSSWIEAGIVGVNPQSIILESSDPLVLLRDSERSHHQPHWIQDTFDQTCLGPMGGFSECGDATLWLVIPKQQRHARRRQWVRWAIEQDDQEDIKPDGYALQMIESNDHLLYKQPDLSKPLDFSGKECLTRRRKDSKLVIAPCTQERAWAWQFNEHGILHFEKPKSNKKTHPQKRLLGKQRILDCVGRNASEAILLACNGEPSQVNLTSDLEQRVVQIALVRQATTASNQPTKRTKDESLDDIRITEEIIKGGEAEVNELEPVSRLPSHVHVDIAHIHASGPAVHAQLTAASSRLNSLSSSRKRESESPKLEERPPLRFLIDTNPILIANGKGPSLRNKMKTDNVKPVLHDISSMPLIRKIQVHPYIEASKDNMWTDPKTGLVYRTDLCNYLGHDRKEVGRHTLTGVGQYMKTAFNIKVYGVAFYVSKRDVLADPAMAPFASLSPEELRESSNFFAVLRSMLSSSHPDGGRFDRTIFIKTNMQLALETMQNSLQADWKLLTPEAKDTLIGSSTKPRPASEAMLSVIQSADNPSKCSCAQTAPEELGADPSCCARGTELVFTWRKDGQLEIRLNGDLMDAFHRPDIAAGIFFEYLRLDDPMSTDFLDHVVDGFPFLLAPLSQVRGVSSTNMKQATSSQKKSAPANQRVAKALGDFGDALSLHASNFAGFVQNSANEVSNGAVNTVRSVGDAARNLGEEVERRRELIGNHLSGFASSFYGRSQKSLAPVLPKWIENMNLNIPQAEEKEIDDPGKRDFARILLRFFGQESSMAAVDEIVPMIHPSANSTQRFFFGIVHLYLLLLLIVSFPAERSTRTKFVVVRKTVQALSDSETSDSEESFDISPQKTLTPAKSSAESGPRFRSFGPSRLHHVPKVV